LVLLQLLLFLAMLPVALAHFAHQRFGLLLRQRLRLRLARRRLLLLRLILWLVRLLLRLFLLLPILRRLFGQRFGDLAEQLEGLFLVRQRRAACSFSRSSAA
jgi:hypothetical protein